MEAETPSYELDVVLGEMRGRRDVRKGPWVLLLTVEPRLTEEV